MKLKLFSRNSASSPLPILRYRIFAVFILVAFVLSSCSQKIEQKFTVNEAQKKFEDKCLKDFNLHVRTRQVGRTFWIYLPLKGPIFDYEVQKSSASGEPKNAPKYALNFVDGKFNNNIFSFEYDIIDKKKSKDEDYGFSSSYTDNYVKNQNNLFTSIYEVFFNTKAKAGEVLPQFFVLVITDIKKGIETRGTFYLKDFMRYMSGDIPNDEYMKRFLSDRKGSPSMIGDETGSHIKYKDIPMEEFLTKQIVNRVHFKFQYSDFSPTDNYDNAIVSIAADTLRYYHFEDFTNVRLINLRLAKNFLFDKSQLVNFGEDKPKENKGKLVHIRFKDGKPEFNEEPPSSAPSPAASDEKTNQ